MQCLHGLSFVFSKECVCSVDTWSSLSSTAVFCLSSYSSSDSFFTLSTDDTALVSEYLLFLTVPSVPQNQSLLLAENIQKEASLNCMQCLHGLSFGFPKNV